MLPPTSSALTLDSEGFAEDAARASDREPDHELARRSRVEPGAFAELYRRHYPTVGSYLWRRTGDAHATEDLLAEVFLAALRGIDRARDERVAVRFWLLRIATNLLNKRWRDGALRSTANELELDTHTNGKDATSELQAEEEVRRARRALHSLDPEQQSVLALYYVEGLAIAEIAIVLDCKVGTVKSRLSRAREALAIQLARRR